MKIRRSLFIVLLFCGLVTQLYAAEKGNSPQWKSLFNGKNLDGWKIFGSEGKVNVTDGAFVCNMTRNTPEHTFVCTKEKYDNFILELDVKTDSVYNTGILIRCVEALPNVDTTKVRLYGYQVKIDPTSRKWTGGVFDDYGKTWHWLFSLANDARAREAFSVGKWNHFRIEAIGSTIKTWVNGVPATNLINKKYTKGYIAIKIHSMGNTPELENIFGRFKNIRIITKNPEKYTGEMDIEAKEVAN